jgi:AhpD family alkylhydroperoxidase
MQQRIAFKQAAPDAYTALAGVQAYVNKSGLEHSLLELVKLRASQINGCAFCLQMHTTDAVKAGERHERLYLLSAWRETELYSPRERAALAWTEALTLVADTHVPDEVYGEARRHFSEKELVDLTYAVVTINGWNRICVAFRIPPAVSTPSAAA